MGKVEQSLSTAFGMIHWTALVIPWTAFLAGGIYLVLLLVKLSLAAIYVAKVRRSSAPQRAMVSGSCELLTIVQPILSGDPRLYEMLAGNLRSLPECVRFVWLVDDNDAEGMRIARSLIPTGLPTPGEPRVRIVGCPPAPERCNPKAFKLQLALDMLETELLAVVDDDTHIGLDSLEAALHALESVDLYTGLPSYLRGDSIGSDWLAHFVNNNAVLTYIPPLVFSPPISLNGMFYVARVETLRQLGGFRAIEIQLCDDHAVHRLFVEQGRSVCQGLTRQRIATTAPGVKRVWQILHRWHVFALLLVREQSGWMQCYLAAFLGLPPLLLWMTFCLGWLSLPALIWLLGVLMCRQAIIRGSHQIVFKEPLSMNPITSLLVELSQPLYLLGAVCLPVIRWRGHRIRVGRGGTFVRVIAS